MGRLNKGILTDINGSIGPVSGYTRRGKDFIRSKPGKGVKKAPSQNQLIQRAKFALIVKFTKCLNPVISRSFEQPYGSATASNRALSYNLLNAISGDYPDFEMDYPNAAISEGSIRNPDNLQASVITPATISFKWTPNEGAMTKPTDRCVALAYCPELNMFEFTGFERGATRTAGTDELKLPYFTGKKVHCWVFFKSSTTDWFSSSVYAGEFLIN